MKPGGQKTEEPDEADGEPSEAATAEIAPASMTAPADAAVGAEPPSGPLEAVAKAGEKAAAADASQRVDWTAILEERALVPDSEEASPVAVPKMRPGSSGRRRGLLYVVVAVTALFSVAASAAVVITLVRANSGDDGAPPRAATLAEPAPAGPAEPAPAATPAPTPAAAPTPALTAAPAAPTPPPTEPPAGSKPAAAPPEKTREPDDKSRHRKRDRAAEKPEPAGPDKGEPDKGQPDKGQPDKGQPDKGQPDKGQPAAAASGERPEKPSAKDVAKAVEAVKPRIDICAKENGVSGSAAIKLEVQPDGKIAWSAVREGGEAFQSCVARVIRDVRLPPSQKGGTVVHSVNLPDP